MKARRPDYGPAACHEVAVPIIHRFGPYRFYFYSAENAGSFEPPHIHASSGDGSAVLWLAPVSVREAYGYAPREVERIRRIVTANRDQFLRRWHEYFDPID